MKKLPLTIATVVLAAGSASAQNVWNGSGVGANTGSTWDTGASYLAGSATFNSTTDLDFSRITVAGPTTLTNSTGGTFAVKDILFGTTSSTINTAETLTIAGNGTAGATTISLAGNISAASPASSRVILASDLTLDLGNAAHTVRFYQNNNVNAAPAATTSSYVPVVVIDALLTGGGASASLTTSFSNYGLTPPSTTLATTPAIVLTNAGSTANFKVGGTSGFTQRLSYASIANVGQVSALGAGTGANATIRIGNGGALDYIGTASQSSDRPIDYVSTFAIENLSASGNATLTFTGAFTNVHNAATTMRLGASAGNTLELDTVIADGAGAAVTNISILSGTTSPYYRADGTTASGILTGKTFLSRLNTYTGSTTINGGTLNVTTFADINTPSGLGKGSAAGSAADLVIGGGTLQHTAANTASTNRLLTVGNGSSPHATIDSSALSPDHTLSFTSTGTLVNGNTSTRNITFTGSNTGANLFNPSIVPNSSGTNLVNVIKSGAGTWVLGGTNTYTGTTTVSANGGILVYGTTAAKSSGSAVTVNSGGHLGFRVGGSGYFGSADLNTVFQAPSGVATSGYTFAAGSGVAIDTTQGNFTYATSQTSARTLAKIGVNALTLSGTGTYAGVSVRQGSLVVNGALTGAVSVTGGTLGGTGTINSAATFASGTSLSPGDNGVGNLTFGAGLTLGGSYVWELASASTTVGQFDSVTLTGGDLTLSGATVSLNLGANTPGASAFWQSNQTWTLIGNSGSGSVAGTFASIDNSAWSSFGDFSTAIVGNEVALVWTSASSVPEPSASASLAGLAALGIFALRRRRKA